MAARRRLPRDPQPILLEIPPPLHIEDFKTSSSAIHPIDFVGDLRHWTTFQKDAQTYLANHNWQGGDMTLFDRASGLPYSLTNEHIVVGDETGVQGRFNQFIGQAMGAVFRSQNIALRFADSRASQPRYESIPDSVLIDESAIRKVVGELKVPWVQQHILNEAMSTEVDFRCLIGQIAKYMQDLHLKFGFMSNYDETVFFKLEGSFTSSGTYTIMFYSDVIYRDDFASDTAGAESVTMRQAFFFVGCLAAQNHRHFVRARPGLGWTTSG